jgi:hypothetical protein
MAGGRRGSTVYNKLLNRRGYVGVQYTVGRQRAKQSAKLSSVRAQLDSQILPPLLALLHSLALHARTTNDFNTNRRRSSPLLYASS